MTCSSQPVSNTMQNAPFPENGDRVACSIFFRMTFSLLVISAGTSRPRRGHPLPAADNFLSERDSGSACRHGPSRKIAVMDRHERIRSELAAGFEAQKKKGNLDGGVLLSVGPKTRRQPRGLRPPPRGAASVDQGTRGGCPQLPLQRSSRYSTSLPPSRTGVSRELCGPRRGTELFSGAG